MPTLDQEYATYQGKSVLVPGASESDRGQCVQWADYVLHDVYMQPYHYANAIDWWRSPSELSNHFDKVSDGSIKKGDFVIFNEKVGSVYGHIDVAMNDASYGGFTGADSNWGGNKTVHQVNHSTPSYVLGVLRLRGGQVQMTDKNQINAFCWAFFGRSARQAEIDTYSQLPLQETINRILTSQEYLNYHENRDKPQPVPGATKLNSGLYQVN